MSVSPIVAAVQQLARGEALPELLWMIDGVHHGPHHAIWIAVCSDGQVQRRTRSVNAVPSATGKGRQDFDVEVLGTTSGQAITWLAQTLVSYRFNTLMPPLKLQPDEPKYTLKVAMGKHRFDLAAQLPQLEVRAELKAIHDAFCWVRDNLGTPAPQQE